MNPLTQLKSKIQSQFSVARLATILTRVTAATLEHVKAHTPYRPPEGTGKTRKAWHILPSVDPLKHVIENPTRVMRFLEYGTPAGNPGGRIYPKIARALFIPLTRRAAEANRGSAAYGKFRYQAAAGSYNRRGISLFSKKKRSMRLWYGSDYVLAKSVRGIKPMKIAQRSREFAKALLQTEVQGMMGKVTSG